VLFHIAANPEMPTPKPSFMYILSNSGDLKNNQSVEKRFPKLEYALTNYIEDFISHIWNGENLFACQFHPEKSSEVGLTFLKNFINL